jgi:hypothetical protein
MGWILTSKKKKADEELAAQEAAAEAAAAAAKGSTGAAAKQVHWNPGSTLMKVRIGVGIVSVVAAGFGWVWMTGALERYAAARLDRDDTPVASVELANAPAWMSVKLREQLQGVAGQKISNDPIAGKELQAAYAEFSNNPWVESVKSVRRTSGGGILIQATYREPVAMVDQPEGLRWVDAKGVLLPGLWTNKQSGPNLPLVRGVKLEAPEADGEMWNAPDLQAGLAMIKTMRPTPYFQQVMAYNVEARDAAGRVRLSMVTSRGLIMWGLPPGQEQAIEPGAEHKLKLVAEVFKGGQGGVAGGDGPRVEMVSNRMANVYGQELTYAPLPVDSREGGRTVYTSGR